MEDPRIISALFIFLKMAYYNVLINTLVPKGHDFLQTIGSLALARQAVPEKQKEIE